MKILHVCTVGPLSYKGGITNYVRELAITQHDEGHSVYVLGAPDSEEYDFHYIPFTSSIVPFTFTPLVDKQALGIIEDIIKKENFDIIHLHALEYIDWDIYSILKGQRYVVSLHDYCFICPRTYMYSSDGTVCEKYDAAKCSKCVSYLDRFRLLRGTKNKINEYFGTMFKLPYVRQNITSIRYEKFSELLNNANYILPVSYKVEKIYKESGIVAKSQVLHIGNKSAEEYQESFEYNTTPHKLKIVFLGRLIDYKGANLFIRIANDLKDEKDIEFHFWGNEGSYGKKLSKAKVINHGKYKPEELASLLKEFDMGMVLSIWHDNGPQVVMELINNHVPVIGTKMGGIPDFITEDTGYVFDPYSEKEIEQVEDYIRNLTTEKIYKMKKNIRRTITMREHYEELMHIYMTVLEEDTNK